ncbi:MAG: hypothetical protein H0W65_10150 [Sphingomonas sp.]|uniref:hypothetical protein n=1 Tax=Sphingomonas sp. TaxID=28214 RepID=UPI001856BCE8|nr:hypothetical protein [Sphingomonas sp.]MBA3668065.1 hypothetical protein [Sphingomonas sp.]
MTISTQFVLSRIPSKASPFGRAADSHDAEQQRKYDRLATLYESGLRELGAPITCLDAPSIYQTTEALAAIGVEAASVHLAVRPIAAVRPFHGLPDYVVFDGPMGDLDRAVPDSLRSADDILMAAKRVFCTTAILTDALIARGIVTATTLPPPTTIEAKDSHSDLLQQLDATTLASSEPITIASVLDTTRAVGGQVVYWDSDEAADVDAALGILIDAAKKSGMRSATCSLIIAGSNPFIGPRARFSRQNFDGIYRIERTLDYDEKRSLARASDIFIRVSVSTGLDLDALAAVENGVLTIVPQGHSAIELIGSQSLSTYRPTPAMSRWGSRSRQECPDLIRSLKEAIEAPFAERATRRCHAKDWVRSTYGLNAFAKRLRSQVDVL